MSDLSNDAASSQGSSPHTREQRAKEDRAVESWVCMDCGNAGGFQVIYYDICQLDQGRDGASYSGFRSQPTPDESNVLQMACGVCQSTRVGRRRIGGEQETVPGRWVRSPVGAAATGDQASPGNLDEVAPSLGVPESRGADGSVQWDVENPVAGTKLLVAFNEDSRMASIYVRVGNAFVGYTALQPITRVLSDLDEGEVQFIAERDGENLTLSVTADGVFFLRSGRSA